MAPSGCKNLSASLLSAFLALALTATATHAVTIDWVTVGDPGNAADDTGNGAVAQSFRIMKYEWTNSLYVTFLNAVDPDGTNPNSVYNSSMDSSTRAGITNIGTTNGSRYAVKTDWGDKPVNFVSWFDAARVANWLHNGAQAYGSTDASANAPQNTGAYTIGTVTSGSRIAANSGAKFYIPTADQWYKAAYYIGGETNAGYWDYATQSNARPTSVECDSAGIGLAGPVGNSANYNYGADWNTRDGNVTTVGTNGGPGTYGTFDMNGNVMEWNDPATGFARQSGGGYSESSSLLKSDNYQTFDESTEGSSIGFRLASPPSSPSGVPEIDPAGMGSVLALVTGALALRERRRYGR